LKAISTEKQNVKEVELPGFQLLSKSSFKASMAFKCKNESMAIECKDEIKSLDGDELRRFVEDNIMAPAVANVVRIYRADRAKKLATCCVKWKNRCETYLRMNPMIAVSKKTEKKKEVVVAAREVSTSSVVSNVLTLPVVHSELINYCRSGDVIKILSWFNKQETRLWKGMDSILEVNTNYSPLAIAIETRNIQLVRLLLEFDAGCKIYCNGPRKLKETPLHHASRLGFDDIVLELVRHKRVQLCAKDHRGRTAFLSSIAHCTPERECEFLECAKLLEDCPHDRDKDGNLAIHHAVICESPMLVEHLLKTNGSCARSTNKNGATPLHLSARNTVIMSLLIRHGGDVTAVDSTGKSVLSMAVFENNVEAVNLLLDRGSSCMEVNGSSLHYACKLGRNSVILCILSHSRYRIGINSSDTCWPGDTPLHAAIRVEKWDTVKLLLNLGADCNVLNKKHENALVVAACHVLPVSLLTMVLETDPDRHVLEIMSGEAVSLLLNMIKENPLPTTREKECMQAVLAIKNRQLVVERLKHLKKDLISCIGQICQRKFKIWLACGEVMDSSSIWPASEEDGFCKPPERPSERVELSRLLRGKVHIMYDTLRRLDSKNLISVLMRDGAVLQVHKFILSWRCSYFAGYFRHEKSMATDTITMAHLDPVAVACVFEYLYTGDTRHMKALKSDYSVENMNEIIDLIHVAHELILESLQNDCEASIGRMLFRHVHSSWVLREPQEQKLSKHDVIQISEFAADMQLKKLELLCQNLLPTMTKRRVISLNQSLLLNMTHPYKCRCPHNFEDCSDLLQFMTVTGMDSDDLAFMGDKTLLAEADLLGFIVPNDRVFTNKQDRKSHSVTYFDDLIAGVKSLLFANSIQEAKLYAADIILDFGNESMLFVHSFILQHHHSMFLSGIFNDRAGSDESILDLSSCDHSIDTWRDLLMFMYTGSAPIIHTVKQAADAVSLSELLGVSTFPLFISTITLELQEKVSWPIKHPCLWYFDAERRVSLLDEDTPCCIQCAFQGIYE